MYFEVLQINFSVAFQNFFATSMEFLKLEKVEIGGLKGRLLGTKVSGVLSQFHETFAVFGGITYDPLEPEDESFVEDYALFIEKVGDMDRKLAAIFCQAFDDCHSLDGIYKVGFVLKLILVL
jgi:dynein heavy chain